jgi:hypothetical protein
VAELQVTPCATTMLRMVPAASASGLGGHWQSQWHTATCHARWVGAGPISAAARMAGPWRARCCSCNCFAAACRPSKAAWGSSPAGTGNTPGHKARRPSDILRTEHSPMHRERKATRTAADSSTPAPARNNRGSRSGRRPRSRPRRRPARIPHGHSVRPPRVCGVRQARGVRPPTIHGDFSAKRRRAERGGARSVSCVLP